jgi:hypothetical protein
MDWRSFTGRRSACIPGGILVGVQAMPWPVSDQNYFTPSFRSIIPAGHVRSCNIFTLAPVVSESSFQISFNMNYQQFIQCVDVGVHNDIKKRLAVLISMSPDS